MPPRASLTSSFSITDSNNEVVCPLRNQDGSSCRKRCIGEKRYRSMQEHIRRAHPEHYISKLPATEDSFMLMISTPPNERPPSQQNASPMSGSVSMGSGPLGVNINGPPAHGGVSPVSTLQHKPYLHDTGIMHREGPNGPNGFIGPNGSNGSNGPGGPSGSNGPNGPSTPSMRAPDEYGHNSILPAASAAAALAQLHNHKLERDWEEANPPIPDGWQSENDKARLQRSSVELPPIHMANPDVNSEPFPGINHNRPRELLPSILSTSPPGRSSTLPPLQRPLGSVRPRKQSITKRARESHHKKQKSRGLASDWLSKIQNESTVERLRASGQVKAMSAEPSDVGKRWEDLIDAAASATEDIDDDRTPVPQSPISIHRSSLPPFPHQTFQHHQHQQGYQASPLQQALTPPNYTQEAPEPFPSIESNESGEVFNMESRGLSDSSPAYSSQNPQIYCAACGNISLLKESYACTECICGLCQTCVEVLMSEQGARRKCPRCHTIGGRFKPFQLDIR